MIPLQHRASAATAAIDAAKTPMQKRDARADGLAVHADLEKQIAQLFAQIIRAPEPRLFQRVKRFVGFLQKHRRQRGVRLFAVPRTTAGRTQTIH